MFRTLRFASSRSFEMVVIARSSRARSVSVLWIRDRKESTTPSHARKKANNNTSKRCNVRCILVSDLIHQPSYTHAWYSRKCNMAVCTVPELTNWLM